MRRIPAHFDGNLQGMSEIKTRVNLNKAKKIENFQSEPDRHSPRTNTQNGTYAEI